MRGEPPCEEPDGQEQLEETAWDQRQKPGTVCHIDHVEHGQDASHQEDRIADEPQHGEVAWHHLRRPQRRGEDEPGRTRHGVDGEHVRVPPSMTRQEVRPDCHHGQALRQPQDAVGLRATRGVWRQDPAHRQTVRSHRDAVAAEKEQASDQRGLVRGRAREVRVDQRVADREGEGGGEEEHANKHAGLPCGCRGRSTLLLAEELSRDHFCFLSSMWLV